MVHSSHSFLLESNLHFSLVVFVLTSGILALIFFFFGFLSDFFKIGFPNSLIVSSRSRFCLVNENFLNCTSGLVLLCFLIIRFTF